MLLMERGVCCVRARAVDAERGIELKGREEVGGTVKVDDAEAETDGGWEVSTSEKPGRNGGGTGEEVAAR